MILGQFQFRTDPAALWTANNPILLKGELGIEDAPAQPYKFKIGDGITPWNDLPYSGLIGPMGEQGPRGFDGWEPILAVVSDGQRRVLQLVDWTGGEGTKPTAFVGQYLGANGYTSVIGQATDIRGETGETGATGATGATGPQGAQGNDGWEPVLAVESDGERRVLRLVDWIGGGGTKPAVPANSYIGPTGFTNLAGATDIRGATGQTGATGETGATGATGPQGPAGPQGPQGPAGVLPATTRTAPTASASTALTTIQSFPIAAGEIVPGSEYEFEASLRVINTTAASNAVVTLSVGATNVLVLTQAIGTTAAAAPGAAVVIRGRITFYSATQAECEILAIKQAAVAFTALANTSAPITVSAAGATTIDLKFNTSAATSTFIARQATIRKVK